MKSFVMTDNAPDATTYVLTRSTGSPWALLDHAMAIPVYAAPEACIADLTPLVESSLGYAVTLVPEEPRGPAPFYFVIPAGGGQ